MHIKRLIVEGCHCIAKMDGRLVGAGIAVLQKMEIDIRGTEILDKEWMAAST